MLNHNQAAIVLMIGIVAVLMTSTYTRVFVRPAVGAVLPFQNLAEPILAQLPSHFFSEENKLNIVLQGEQNKIAADEHATASKQGANIPFENVPP